MPTLDDVYCKFGFVSEAAQLIETELGTALLFFGIVDEGLLSPVTLQVNDVAAAKEVMSRINRQTLGQLLRSAKRHTDELNKLEPLLGEALDTRNRLAHNFYRQHNLRRNTEAGRAIMLADLEAMHEVLLKAYKALVLLSGVDLDKVIALQGTAEHPTPDETVVFHLPI